MPSLTISTPGGGLSRDLLHSYQRRAVDFIKTNPKCALWVEMGLGKSVSTLTAIADLEAEFAINRVLIIAPLRVARSTWPAELERWAHTRHLDATVIKGTPAKRSQIVIDDRSTIHIINRELVPWLVTLVRESEYLRERGWPYDMVVIDEASGFKSHKTKRFKALKKVLPSIDRLVELTGTPASNGLLDVWAQLFLLDQGQRLGKTFTSYQRRYFESDYMGFNWTPKDGADAQIHGKLEDICLTLAAADYLDMPPLVENDVVVELPPAVRSQYADLERDFLLKLEADETVEVFNAAALANKLLQFANGAVYLETDAGRETRKVHDVKLDALDDIVEGTNGTPLLVAYNFQSDAARILGRFPQAQLLDKDPATIDAWNAGEIEMLVAHPASAGHGLNLQAGGSNVVWFGLNWSLELYQQFNARLHRQGQTKPVIIHRVMCADTAEQTVAEALVSKNTTQRALLDALKTDLEVRR